MKYLSPSIFSFLLFLSHYSLATNGSIAYIYPISGITVDGNLSDWPNDIRLYQMETTHYGGGLKSPEDGNATWRAGYDASTGHLYVGVTMIDDDYVKTPDNNHYTIHDF